MMLNSTLETAPVMYKGDLVKPPVLDFDNHIVETNFQLKSRLTPHEFRQLLISISLVGASDLTFQSDCIPRIKVKGHYLNLGSKLCNPMIMDTVIGELYGASNAPAEIKARKVLDFTYSLKINEENVLRCRTNAIGVSGWDNSGMEISLRLLPQTIPSPANVGLTSQEVQLLSPSQGLVIVAGATGSGKTSTLAAIIRNHLKDHHKPQKIITIEAPIEYLFNDFNSFNQDSSSSISQSEVGTHIVSFASGVRSALRRNPDIIVVGEARDTETINAMLEASFTGHLVYTTTHAASIEDTVRRLVVSNSASEYEIKAYDLMSTLQTIMVQELVLKSHQAPGLVAIRQSLRFTELIREELLGTSLDNWPHLIRSYPKVGNVDELTDAFV